MVEVGGGLGFRVEALDVGVIGELAGQDHLERDLAIEAHLPRLKNNAHTAAGDLADDFVVAEVADGRSCGPPGPRRLELCQPDGRVAPWRHGGLLVHRRRRGARDRLTWQRRRDRRVGNRGGRGDLKLGRSRRGSLWHTRDRFIHLAQFALQGLELGPQRGAAFCGNVIKVVLDRRSPPSPPFGLEPATDGVDSAGQLDVEAAEVLARLLTHLDGSPTSRSIGCSALEPGCQGQTVNTHFKEDVRFSRGCDFVLVVRSSRSVWPSCVISFITFSVRLEDSLMINSEIHWERGMIDHRLASSGLKPGKWGRSEAQLRYWRMGIRVAILGRRPSANSSA